MTSLPTPYNLIGLIISAIITLSILGGVTFLVAHLGFRPAHKPQPDKLLPLPETKLLPSETEEVPS